MLLNLNFKSKFSLRGPSVGILGTHFLADSDRGGWVLLESTFFFESQCKLVPQGRLKRGGMGGKIYHNSKQGLELDQNSQIEICHYLASSPLLIGFSSIRGKAEGFYDFSLSEWN